MSKTIEETIKTILEFKDKSSNAKIEHPFSIIGPSGGENKLRVYAYGGLAGSIGIGKAGSSLCNRDYLQKYKGEFDIDEKKQIATWIKTSRSKNKEITGDWVCDVLGSQEYLKIVLKALKTKFSKNNGSDKERNIQMEILSHRNSNRRGWNIIDVETGITKQWVKKDNSMIETVKKPDFIVYNNIRREFGIIELKVDNENTENLGEHYTMFHAIYNDPAYFIEELSRRANIMSTYGLADNETYSDSKKIWFGFLFIGKGIVGAQNCIKKHLLNCVPIEQIENDCRFLYADTADDMEKRGLCYDRMTDINEFMSQNNENAYN